ncbi:DUF3558 domain-containing protein [Streptomyces sp. NPDC050619]|uniref:DUF3558 domain-containing protein n=1 Tax=Streptomyces sp. NPDC050619 TaxID=3157214 RepID=UPI003430C942
MQRKAYVSGVVALLAALLAGCTGSSDDGGDTDNANPGDTGTASAAAQPGKYRTLPEPCGAVGQDTLDSLLPGIQQIADQEQRDKAYAGEATPTFDTDRKVGCRWTVESTDATDHLLVDFERVVSYDNSVSDDTEAQQLFATKEEAADLPEPATSSPSTSASNSPSTSASPGTSTGTSTDESPSGDPSDSAGPSDSAAPSGSGSPSSSISATPSTLQPRILEGLGDDAFLDDALSGSGSTAQQRTVTVAFRTSNVIVTIAYEEQPMTVGVTPNSTPDSKEMQDKARKLAAQLAETLTS